jgi:hypothetical protein
VGQIGNLSYPTGNKSGGRRVRREQCQTHLTRLLLNPPLAVNEFTA